MKSDNVRQIWAVRSCFCTFHFHYDSHSLSWHIGPFMTETLFGLKSEMVWQWQRWAVRCCVNIKNRKPNEWAQQQHQIWCHCCKQCLSCRMRFCRIVDLIFSSLKFKSDTAWPKWAARSCFSFRPTLAIAMRLRCIFVGIYKFVSPDVVDTVPSNIGVNTDRDLWSKTVKLATGTDEQ
jgi:hypothetical protein